MPRTFCPTSATQIDSLPNLHPCSRCPKKHSDSHPTSSRDSPVHAAGPASAGPLERRQGVRLPASWRSTPLAPLSRSPLASSASQPSEGRLTRLGDFRRCRRDASTKAFTTRDAFCRCRFERRHPAFLRGVGWHPLSRIRPVPNLANPRGIRLFDSPKTSVRPRGLALTRKVRTRSSLDG